MTMYTIAFCTFAQFFQDF